MNTKERIILIITSVLLIGLLVLSVGFAVANKVESAERIEIGNVSFLSPENCGEYYEDYNNGELTWIAFQDPDTAISVSVATNIYNYNDPYEFTVGETTEWIEVDDTDIRIDSFYDDNGNLRSKVVAFVYKDMVYIIDAGTWKTKHIKTAISGLEYILDTLNLK